MTSYPVGNKTSLSGKPCIPDKKLLWNANIGSHGRVGPKSDRAGPGQIISARADLWSIRLMMSSCTCNLERISSFLIISFL